MNIHAIRVSLLLWALPLAVLAQAPSTDGLIAYWKFDETSGTTALDPAGSNHATLNPGASFAVDQGQSGGALLVGDGPGVATVPSFDIGGSAITIAAWVYPNVSGAGGVASPGRIISKASSSKEYFVLTLDTPRSIQFRMRLNDKTYTYSAPANLIDEGAWSHVAYTYNGSQVRLYHNGALVTTYSASGMLTAGPGVDLGIGNNPAAVGTGNPLNGKLDELRVYNRSLSDSEIAALISVQAYRQLPVTFTSFRAEPAFAGVELKWTVEDQRDNAGFAVERATGDEGVFTEVGFVAAHAHGDYHYTDYYAPQNATLYYRLRQVDHDGSEMYSSLVTVAPQQRQELSVYPNPASAYLRVNGSGPYAILDAYGRRVGSGMATDHQSIAVADLPAGTYTLHVNREAVRFVKQ